MITNPDRPSPLAILQTLLRFDTTNPPGNEGPAVAWAKALLDGAGLTTAVLARTPDRPNLVARLQGRGQAPPLLLYGHLDVVTTQGQTWRHPPFAGELIDGYIWGRGALDMKGGLAMYLAALLRAQQNGAPPPGDVILALVADEEVDGAFGSRFLVEQHPDLFAGVCYALGEIGGFSLTIAGKKLYPIMVAEKQMCQLRAVIRGPGGHGSLTMRGGAMARLGRLLLALDRGRLPVHITPPLRAMVAGMAAALPAVPATLLRQLLNPRLTKPLLGLLGAAGALFEPLVHNTVNATILRGGEKINVIPSEIQLRLDGRLLPGFSPDDMLAELHALVGTAVEINVDHFEPCPPKFDLGLFDLLGSVLRQADPGGTPVPFMLAAVTDARFFSRLGIQTYGFTPMQLPGDLAFASIIHGADERIPADSLEFGAQAVYQVLQSYQ